ncbi:unnamed protein product [Hymenolepis diminuta]|uniref:Uncharacterized protein n=1 Tax=Hymenolepis diminuta TaxID=6216 RepID=A0A564YAT7_HYMDI|nr:unnamed protein product [Hymenolepis diminuta]
MFTQSPFPPPPLYRKSIILSGFRVCRIQVFINWTRSFLMQLFSFLYQLFQSDFIF